MAIEFIKTCDELVLIYTPFYGEDSIRKQLDTGDDISIKQTFRVNKTYERECAEDEYMESFSFAIGMILGEYIKLSRSVFGTKHVFYVSRNMVINAKFFIVDNNISILKKIDEIIDEDVYIGGDSREGVCIPKVLYENLLASFPGRTEKKHYTNKRVSLLLRDVLDSEDKYRLIYEKYISKREQDLYLRIGFKNYNSKIELAQFIEASKELQAMLDNEMAYSERAWQLSIQPIMRLLYPKYLFFEKDIKLKCAEDKYKIPDYIMIDNSGFVDILEMKKPEVSILTEKPSYRDNYVPTRELSGAIQQIEKYLYCLNTIPNNTQIISKKLEGRLPKGLRLNIVNPIGIILAGRSNSFNDKQKRDFEVIKRQYKNVVDIMTYDDLINRIENIIETLKMEDSPSLQ